MTLENIVKGASAALKGTLAAGLMAGAVYSKDASAQEPSWLASSVPESVCAQRYDTLFSSGSEPLDQVVPAGVQNCASLESTFDPTRSAGSSITVSLVGDQSYDFALVKTLPGESAHGQYSAVGIPSFASFDSEYGVLSLSPSCADVGFHPGGSYNVFDSDMPLVINYDVRCGVAPVLDGVDLDGDGVADLVNSGGSLPDFVWLRDFPVTVGLVGDASSYSASLGSVSGDSWSLNESVGGSYTLTAHRDGLEDSASGSLLLRDAVLERLGANDFVSGSASFSIPCGSEYSGELVTNTDDLLPSVTDSYSSSNLPNGASVSGDSFSYTPSCAQGSPENVSFGLTPTISQGGNNKTLDEYLVDLTITGVAQGPSFDVLGLGVISDTEVTQTGRFDYTLNTSTNEINRAVSVRENRPGFPYDVHVLTNKQDVDVSILGGGAPYITTSGNRIDFTPPDETEGDSGTLELMVCDTASPSDCSTLYVPWEITDVQAKLAGYSTIGAYEAVTHPNVGGGTETFIDVPCDLGHTGWIIPEEIYKGQGFEGFNMPPGMGVNSNIGRVSWNTDCGSLDYPPGTQVFPGFAYGNSGGLTVGYKITNPSGTQSDESRKPDYR